MTISRRAALQALGVAAVGAPLSLSAQGRCMLTFGTPACNTTDITPIFEPTGWKTVALDHLTFRVADYRKEAAFYIALMGWKLRSDDGTQAVLDMGDWGSAIFRQAAPGAREAAAADGGRGRGGPVRAGGVVLVRHRSMERREGRGGAPEARHGSTGRQRRQPFRADQLRHARQPAGVAECGKTETFRRPVI